MSSSWCLDGSTGPQNLIFRPGVWDINHGGIATSGHTQNSSPSSSTHGAQLPPYGSGLQESNPMQLDSRSWQIDWQSKHDILARCIDSALRFLKKHDKDSKNGEASSFHLACWGDEPVLVLEFLEKAGCDIHAKAAHLAPGFSADMNAAHIASDRGNLCTLEWLCNRGVCMLGRTSRGTTPFLVAAFCGHLEVVKWFLDKYPKCHNDQTDPNVHYGYHAVHCASQQGHIKVVEFLCRKFGNHILNDRAGNGYNSLMVASCNGRLELVRWILQQNIVSVNEKAPDGFTAIHQAALGGHLSVLQCLHEKVAHGSNPNGSLMECAGTNKVTPLHLAAFYGRSDVAAWIIDTVGPSSCAAQTHITKYTSAHCAIKGHQTETFKLISSNTLPKYLTSSGDTQFLCAVRHGAHDIAKYLYQTYGPPCLESAFLQPLNDSVPQVSFGSAATSSVDTSAASSSAVASSAATFTGSTSKKRKGKKKNNQRADGHSMVSPPTQQGTSNDSQASSSSLSSTKEVIDFLAERTHEGHSALHLAAQGNCFELLNWICKLYREYKQQHEAKPGLPPTHGQGSLQESPQRLRPPLDRSYASVLMAPAKDKVTPTLAPAPAPPMTEPQAHALTSYLGGDLLITNDHATPILLAAVHGLDSVRLLHGMGASLLTQDAQGNGIAHYAARGGQTSILEYLANNGVSMSATNNLNLAPNDVATEEGHHSAASWISEYLRRPKG